MAHPRRRPKQLIPQERRIYHAELETCPHCGTPLRLSRHYRWRKTVQTLNGVVYVASRPKECPNPGCPQYGKRYPSAAAHQVALPYSTYGLDVVAQIGWWRDHEHLSDTEIHRRLQRIEGRVFQKAEQLRSRPLGSLCCFARVGLANTRLHLTPLRCASRRRWSASRHAGG